MKPRSQNQRSTRALLATALLALVWACGGGTNVATVGTGGTGSFSVGTVTGFGSVIVNGQRFDDSNARVSDDDGSRSKDDLQLGMVVKVEGIIDSTGNGTAASIQFDSELLGPAADIDPASAILVILGQKVLTQASTVYAPSLPKGFDSIEDNQVLEVHGYLQPDSNQLQATLISLKTNPKEFKLSGKVSGLSRASQTFQIDALRISYQGLGGNDVPANLADGNPVKVRLQPTAPAAGQPWRATRVRLNNDALQDRDKVEVEGLITALASTSSFSIGSVRVDASSASFRDGSAGLVLGARVEAKGSVVGGVLMAQEIKLEDDGNEVQLKGSVSSLDAAAKTFQVRGQSLSYSASTRFQGGSEANLANGVQVDVKATISPTSALLTATEIKF